MTTRVLMIVALILLTLTGVGACSGKEPEQGQASFSQQIDVEQLGRLAVHADGRVKSFGSFARSMMQFVSGSRVVYGESPMLMYLDLMLRPEVYEDADVIYVRNKPMRQQIAMALLQSVEQRVHGMWPGEGAPAEQLEDTDIMQEQQRVERFLETGLTSPKVLRKPRVITTINRLRQDLLRTAKFAEELDTAMVVMDPGVLRGSLRLVAPPGGGFDDQWLTLDDLAASLHGHGPPLAHINRELKLDLVQHWGALQDGWRRRDAQAVNAAAEQLAILLPQVNLELYPGEGSRTGWPWSYTQLDWKWGTTLALAGLLMALALGAGISLRPQLAAVGLVCGLGWLAFITGTLMLGRSNPLALESWYFATRNMTWVWLFYAVSLVPLLLSIVFRWTAAQWIGVGMFVLAFALHTSAILIRWYVADRWPNSNMFEAVTTSAWFGAAAAILLEIWAWRTPMRSVFALGAAVAGMVALMCAYFMPVGLDPNIRNMMPVLHDVWLYIHVNVTILSYAFIFVAAVSALLYLLWRLGMSFQNKDGTHEFARMGGAGSLIMTTPDGQTYIEKARSSLGQVLDGTTMVLVELSFILLWTGTVMGAIWADHSWGRPWGWDPKEVFALNTFLVFAVLIHVRLKAKDKGLWTAVIALIGAAVMLFNWIAINFVVVGLHSYA